MQRHRFEAVSLVFGALFAVMGLLFLQGDVDLWRVNWSWFWPAILTFAGVLVLASALSSRERAPIADDDSADLPPLD